MSIGVQYKNEEHVSCDVGHPQGALPFCGPYTGGDLRSTLGRRAWMTVVTGSEWEVPPQSSAPLGPRAYERPV